MLCYYTDEPFTILAPQNSATKRAENLLQQPELVKKLVLDHVVLGSRIDLTNITSENPTTTFQTLGGRSVHVQRTTTTTDGNTTILLKANQANVVQKKIVIPNGLLVVLDNYLFQDDDNINKTTNSTTTTTEQSVTIMKTTETTSTTTKSITSKKEQDTKNQFNTTFVENIMEVLSFLKSGVRVFQHFVSRSNVSKLLDESK